MLLVPEVPENIGFFLDIVPAGGSLKLWVAGKTRGAFETAPQFRPRKTFNVFISLLRKEINNLKKFENQEMGSGEKP